jgi:biotin operon repressor
MEETNANTPPDWAEPDGPHPSVYRNNRADLFSMAGFVKLHRSLKDWEWYGDEAATRLFIHLLLEVNWKPGRWRGVDIPPGSMVTSLEKLAARLGWDRSKLRRTLNKLKSTGEVNIKTTNHWTLVTVDNWAKYQDDDQQSDQPKSQPPTNHRPTTDRPPNTIEEGKKERREEGKKSLAGKPPKRDIDWLKAECRAVVDADPTVLVESERKGFFDYWTEPSASGRLRFQAEGFFDVRRRMQTWQRNADKRKPSGQGGQPAGMSRAEAMEALRKIRAQHGIPVGGFIEAHLIPDEVNKALR